MRGGKAGRDLRLDVEEGLGDALSQLSLGGGGGGGGGGGRPRSRSSSSRGLAEPGDEQPTPPASASQQDRPPALLIGGRAFASGRAARQYVQQLKKRRLDELITPADPDWPFLSALLARHPRAGAAVQPHPRSPPVTAFVARRHRGSQAEWHYIDGSGEEDFSAIKCIRGGTVEEDNRRRLQGAMADAVAGKLWAFKARRLKRAANRRCDRCGGAREGLAREGWSVDCEPGGRAAVADAFLAGTRLAVPREFHSHPRDHRPTFRPADRPFAAAWTRYFSEHASLRLLCGACLAEVHRERQLAAAAESG